jgi:hypothetical protein
MKHGQMTYIKDNKVTRTEQVKRQKIEIMPWAAKEMRQSRREETINERG